MKRSGLLWLGMALLLFALLFVFQIKHNMVDFQVNFEAGKRLRWAESLYQYEDQHFMFKYLPVSAIVYAPLTFLPLDAAKAIWYLSIVICSGLIVYLSYRILPESKTVARYFWLLPPLILIKFFFRELDLGQINSLVTLVLLLMIWALSASKDLWAGVLWGLSVALKPYSLIFFPYLLVKKKFKSLWIGLLGIGLAFLIPALYYGFKGNLEVHKEWWQTLSQSTPNLLSTWDNISIIAFFMKWTGNRSLSLILAGLVIGLVALLMLWLIYKGKAVSNPIVLEGAALLLLTPLVSPLGWDYTLFMALPAVMILIYNFSAFPRAWKVLLVINWAVIFLSVYDIMGREFFAAFMTWSIPTLNFLFLFVAMLYLRKNQVC